MNIKDILTLSDKKRYVIASKTNYEGKIYLYIVDLENNNNTKFCNLYNNKLIVVRDTKLIKKLLPLLLKSINKKEIINYIVADN